MWLASIPALCSMRAFTPLQVPCSCCSAAQCVCVYGILLWEWPVLPRMSIAVLQCAGLIVMLRLQGATAAHASMSVCLGVRDAPARQSCWSKLPAAAG